MYIVNDVIDLTSDTNYYYPERKPRTTGNYWHYDANVNPVV